MTLTVFGQVRSMSFLTLSVSPDRVRVDDVSPSDVAEVIATVPDVSVTPPVKELSPESVTVWPSESISSAPSPVRVEPDAESSVVVPVSTSIA